MNDRFERALLIRASERFCSIWSSYASNSRVALFVHGLNGNYLKSWGNLRAILEKSTDPVLMSWDYAFIGYNTPSLRSACDVTSVIERRVHQASAADDPFPHGYEAAALIGHSLGSLAVRDYSMQASCRMPSIVSRVATFAEPANGSKLATTFQTRILGAAPWRVLDDLVIESTYTRQLRRFAPCLGTHHPMPNYSNYHARADRIVHWPHGTPYSWPYDTATEWLPGSHRGVVRAKQLSDPFVQKLIDFLR
jgi:hypothetical protein